MNNIYEMNRGVSVEIDECLDAQACAEVEKLLIGRKVIEVTIDDKQDARLLLDNGVVLHTCGNQGCGGCWNGWYFLEELNRCDNAITSVEVVNESDEQFSIFVFADNTKINLVTYEGQDNGYYGTGFRLTAYIPKQ